MNYTEFDRSLGTNRQGNFSNILRGFSHQSAV